MEKSVAASLARREIEYYLPLLAVRHSYAKATAVFQVPLFPGYLFLCGDERACDVAWKTNRVANVLQVVDQERLCGELEQIQRILERGKVVDVCPSLRVGRRCRVNGGPLKGVEGIVLSHGHRLRMYLSVTMLGQSAVVEVDASQLDAVE